MADDKTQYKTYNSNYFHLIKNQITPLDLFIISKINEGLTIDEVAELSVKEFNIKKNKSIIKDRLNNLISEDKPENKVIMQSTPQLIINPTKLYSTISLILINAKINDHHQNNIHIPLDNIFDTILAYNNKPQYQKPIKYLIKTTGWIFDFIGFVFTNNSEAFQIFRNQLINQGIISNMEIVPIDMNCNPFFSINDQPDYIHFKNFLIKYQDQIKTMTNEFSQKKNSKSDTMRILQSSNYCLIDLSDKGVIYPIDKSEIKIGRYYDNDIIIDELIVSRRHARIIQINGTYIYEDESTNGTYINNQKIINEEKTLHNGDIITIGKKKLKFNKIIDNKK